MCKIKDAVINGDFEKNDIEAGAVMTVEDAEDLFYKSHTCISDDSDTEQDRIKRWCEEMNIIVTD
jgi:hypothetical protein